MVWSMEIRKKAMTKDLEEVQVMKCRGFTCSTHEKTMNNFRPASKVDAPISDVVKEWICVASESNVSCFSVGSMVSRQIGVEGPQVE